MPIEAVVLESPGEMAICAGFDAHDAEGVKSLATNLRAFVLDQKEVAAVPTLRMGAEPRNAIGLGAEAGRIKSIIDPRLADHVRREALNFIDELRRAD